MWAFPVSQAIHGGEEYGAGYSFHRSLSHLSGLPTSATNLLILHGCFLLAMTLSVLLIRRSARWSWLISCLAVLVLINGLIHLMQAFLQGSYTSGLASSVILWLPLGAIALLRSRSCDTSARFWTGVLTGLAVEIPVAWIALSAGRIPRP